MENNIFNVKYKKNYGRNHMILEPIDESVNYEEELKNNFRVHMIKENNIGGLLQTHIQFTDSIPSFYYDISGVQSLRVVLDSSPLNYELLCKILLGLYNALLSIEKYMLIYEHILSNLNYIFVSPDCSKVSFCYYPLHMEDFNISIRRLFDELLKAVDHTDEKCVFLAYSIHKESLNPDFNINKLVSYLSSVPTASSYSYVAEGNSVSNCENILKEDMCYNIQPTPVDVHSHTSVISTFKKDTSRFLVKIIILGVGSLLTVICATAMFLMGLYDIRFYLILLAIILVVVGYNGYMIYILNAPSKLSSLMASSMSPQRVGPTSDTPVTGPIANETKHRDTSSTVLLSPISEDNIYRLVYVGTDHRYDIDLNTFPFVIGKSQTCDSYLTDPTVSRIHAKIDQITDAHGIKNLVIEDLNSTNGTLLNNIILSPYEKTPLSTGDQISFGGITYMLR